MCRLSLNKIELNISPFILLLVFTLTCFGQLSGQKFGDIEIEDFEVELGEKDKSADAVFLLHNVRIEYSVVSDKIVVYYFIHERIKVLNTSGEEYGEFSIGFWDTSNFREKISGVKGFSFNIENEKVIKTKLSKNQIFTEETSEDYSRRKFAMPNVKPGTIIDLEYVIISPYSISLRKWYFQKEVPVIYSSLEIKVPNEIVLTPIPTGFVPLKTNQSAFTGNFFGGTKFSFTAENVAALKDDDYVLNINDYRSGIKYEISKSNWGTTQEEYSSSWNEIANDLLENSNFITAIDRRFKSLDLQVINAKKLEGEDRVKFLYDYVRDNFRWNKEYGVYIDNINKAVEAKTGNVAEINLLLVNLLKRADCEVQPALLKTRSRGILNKVFPSLSEFNYVVAEVTIGGKVILLDATDKLVPMGNLPTRATSINYLTVQKDGAQIKDNVNPNNYKIINMLAYEVNVNEEVLEGTGQYRYAGYAAVLERASLNKIDDPSEGEQEDSEEDSEGEEVRENKTTTIDVENEQEIDKPITYVFEELLYDQIKIIEDKIFIDACLDSSYDENPFTEEKRDFPIFYSYKYSIKRSHKIKIPEGYIVESLPESSYVIIGEDEGKFLYECREMNGELIIGFSLLINTDIILPEQYEGVKQFYDLIENKHKEKIVLVKT